MPRSNERSMYWIDLGYMEYEKSLQIQKIIVDKRQTNALPDVLLTVEHPHIYTIGRRGKIEDIPQTTIPIVRVERGGTATYHGPGQLVAYPIVSLQKACLDVHQFVNMLEEVGILLLKDYKVNAERIEGKPGVWVNGKKIASIGLAIKNWITYHGIAINVNVDLRYFHGIKPCGFSPDIITSLNEILGRDISMNEVKRKFTQHFAKIFSVKLVEKPLETILI